MTTPQVVVYPNAHLLAHVPVAAEAYAQVLAAAAQPEDHGPVPGFDVWLLDKPAAAKVSGVFTPPLA